MMQLQCEEQAKDECEDVDFEDEGYYNGPAWDEQSCSEEAARAIMTTATRKVGRGGATMHEVCYASRPGWSSGIDHKWGSEA